MLSKEMSQRLVICLFGSVLFALGVNLFIAPLSFYSGGFMGLAQVTNTVLGDFFTFKGTITGTIYFIVNIPLLFLAYKSVGKQFFIKTTFVIVIQTICLNYIPIPVEPLVNDYLTSSIIAGLMTGTGTGIILKAGSSGGGTDIIGIYLTKKFKNFGVGKITILFNIFVFTLVYVINGGNIEIVIYSVIYSFTSSLVIDRTHTQNITVTANIITKDPEMGKHLIELTKRGVTEIKATGVYTGEDVRYLVIIISKYEVKNLKRYVYEKDPRAFVVTNKNETLLGNYIKRLD